MNQTAKQIRNAKWRAALAVNAALKPIQWDRLTGPDMAETRQSILEAIHGVKPPKSHCGIGVVLKALWNLYGAPDGCIAAKNKFITAAIRAEVKNFRDAIHGETESAGDPEFVNGRDCDGAIVR